MIQLHLHILNTVTLLLGVRLFPKHACDRGKTKNIQNTLQVVVYCVKKTWVPADLNEITLCFLNVYFWTKKVLRVEVHLAVCEMAVLNLCRSLENFLLLWQWLCCIILAREEFWQSSCFEAYLKWRLYRRESSLAKQAAAFVYCHLARIFWFYFELKSQHKLLQLSVKDGVPSLGLLWVALIS